MLYEVFYWVFNMSISATIVGAIIMLIRLFKRIPKRLTVFLWAIPFLRMTIPMWLSSKYNLMSLISKFATKTVTIWTPVDNFNFSAMNSAGFAQSYFPVTFKINVLKDVFDIASVVWIVVSSAIILTLIVTYFSTMHEIKDSAHLKDNIYLSAKVTSPAVYGIIKPKIILPLSYKDKEIEMIIMHEKSHIRAGDNLWRVVTFIIVSLHWFNPLCWVFLKLFLTDLELACDERVVAKLSTEQTKNYASALIESHSGTMVFTSAFGGAKIRTRIENILSFRKMTWFSLTGFIALAILIFYTLLTNAG